MKARYRRARGYAFKALYCLAAVGTVIFCAIMALIFQSLIERVSGKD